MVTKRVYVGSVTNNQDDCFSELYTRFQRFGKVTGESETFDQHDAFGYLTMEFESDADFEKLKSNFNRVKFKGNNLRVAEAKPDWKTRWELENKDEVRENKKRKQMAKQEWEHYKKIENVNKSWIDRKQVISGRERKSPRSINKLRNITFRVKVKGNLKVYKCHKTRLWGYEKNKLVRDLVYRFSNNYWRSGTDHIVDKLDYSRANFVSFRNPVGDTVTISHEQENAEDDTDGMTEQEKEKNTMVLASLLDNFDFDKPLAVDEVMAEEEDGNAGAEYEYDALYKESSVKPLLSTKKMVEIPRVKEGEFSKATNVPTESCEEEDGDEEEFMSDYNQKDDSEEEFIPKFGATPQVAENPTNSNSNPTEVLRDLLNPSEPTSFKLIEESDEDIDHQRDFEEEQLAPVTVEPIIPQKSNNPLFFLHRDSPFLVGQTKIAKLKSPATLDEKFEDWEETFWNNRSTWTKELKQRRRDVVRQIRKRRDKYHGNGLLI
ncbi:unnamed protein product [Kluyveromyces dobzhanskii CBS 2104]|uniref:WGS project CCBQ000000000 data, contig 00106 n=1 Tax=Kluyveromyces dobzhanskii CBS 2104 TaxID=1427455 RepID=A0A0A8L5P0_9SACH|nr:unnamed protein product [Kluyveromyces dobzhanskii CBS 2104]